MGPVTSSLSTPRRAALELHQAGLVLQTNASLIGQRLEVGSGGNRTLGLRGKNSPLYLTELQTRDAHDGVRTRDLYRDRVAL